MLTVLIFCWNDLVMDVLHSKDVRTSISQMPTNSYASETNNVHSPSTVSFADHNEKQVKPLRVRRSLSYLSNRSHSISFPVSNKRNGGNSHINSHSYTDNAVFWDIPINNEIDENAEEVSQTLIEKKQQRRQSASSSIDSIKDSTKEETVTICCGFTKHQLKVFLSLIFLSLNDIMGFSAIASFFPVVVEEKGLTAIQNGLIFSAYSALGIFSSLLTGTVLVKVGARFCILAGMFWNAGAIFCFGFVNQASPTSFFILSILCRGLMGFGSNAAFTAMFAIIFQEFSDRAITVLSLSESMIGVGSMLAPLIGGALYDLGGFITPFMVLGSLQILLLITCWFILPYVPIEDKMASRPPLYLLTHSSALVATIVVILVFLVNSFIVSNIGPFLTDQFQWNATLIGVVFLASSIAYAGMSPMWGHIADKWKNSFLTEVGVLGCACGLMLLGPAIFLRDLFGWESQQVWLIYVSVVILGLFFGAAVMPTFNDMLTASTELNMGDSLLAQYGLVSGLWNTGFALGDVMGPTLGGLLVEHYGFQNSAMYLAVACVILFFIKLLHRFYRYRTRDRLIPTSDEEKPLLGDQNND